MSLTENLQRRGAVYYWRRRLPPLLAVRHSTTYIKMSLRTKDPKQARMLAAQLNCCAIDIFESPSMTLISKEQLSDFFKRAFEQHLRKLSLNLDVERADGRADIPDSIRKDRIIGQAYMALAKNGLATRLTNSEREELIRGGMPLQDVREVDEQLLQWRSSGYRPSLNRIKSILRMVKADDTKAVNIVTAQPYYLKALGEALLAAHSQYLLPTMMASDGIAKQIVVNDAGRSKLDQFEDQTPVSEPGPASCSTLTLLAASQKLIDERTADRNWDEKTAAQARFIFSLWSKFMKEVYDIAEFNDLRREHLSAFSNFLRNFPKTYGKSSRDQFLTIDDIRKRAERLGNGEKGLEVGTRNRHLTFLNQLLELAAREGSNIDPKVSWTPFRAKRSTRARDDRRTPRTDQMAALFQLPIFTGCAGWDDMHTAGDQIFHRAVFFRTDYRLLLWHAARRILWPHAR